MTVAVRCQDCDFSDLERTKDCKIRCTKYSCWVNATSKCPGYSHTPSEYFLVNEILNEKKHKILS